MIWFCVLICPLVINNCLPEFIIRICWDKMNMNVGHAITVSHLYNSLGLINLVNFAGHFLYTKHQAS